MGDGESADQGDEPGRDEWDEAIEVAEAYETDDGGLVVYDGKNPLAWIKSTLFGIPIDILEQVDAGDDEEAAGEDQEGT